MSHIQDGAQQPGYADVDSLFALGTRVYPIPGDHFRTSFKTTSLAFTDNVAIASLRNPGASPIIITRLRARVKPMAIFTPAAAGLEVTLQWFVGRSWTVLGTTNRTALTLSGNNAKLRTSFTGSAALEVGFASAVGGITGDTVTLDANPIAQDSGSPQTHSITAAASPGAGVQDSRNCEANFMPSFADGEYPLILAQNEGARLQYRLTGTAAALMVVGEVYWVQATAFPRGS